MALYNEIHTPSTFESEGSIIIGGQKIPYKTVSQDNLIYNDDGKAIGSMFSYSYFRSDVNNEERPIVFIFNGGPGSGSFWLHAGIFGTLRVVYENNKEAVNASSLPPYSVINNDLCMLDICDLVFIDPIGTGYGRLLDKDSGEQVYGIEEDAECFTVFIHSWLNKYNRWQSDKYLIGESYGTIRGAMLAETLTGMGKNDMSSVGLNGVVLLGNAVGFGKELFDFPAEPSLLALPTMAATNWYHHKPTSNTLDEFVKECYDFCREEYSVALYEGASLNDEKKEHIVKKLMYFTGLERDYIVESNIRPIMEDFMKLVLKKEGLEIGIYDGRFTLPKNRIKNSDEKIQDDPAIAQYYPSFMAAMCQNIRNSLNINFERKYIGISMLVGPQWKWECKRTPAQALEAAMRRNPKFRVMFLSGCYDMICQMGQARFLANHAGLDINRTILNEYPSGHMPYLGEESAKMMVNDIRAFITKK